MLRIRIGNISVAQSGVNPFQLARSTTTRILDAGLAVVVGRNDTRPKMVIRAARWELLLSCLRSVVEFLEQGEVDGARCVESGVA
jgi:hypothetical protein